MSGEAAPGRRRQRHGRRAPRRRRARARRPRPLRRSPCSATSRTATTTASCSRACSPAATSPRTSSSTRSRGTRSNGVDAARRRRASSAIDVRREAGRRRRRRSPSPTTRWSSPPAAAPFVPPIDGLRTEARHASRGVFVFRTLDDCERIMRARAKRADARVVIGGGLLGLEAARGLLNRGPRRPRRAPDAAPDGGAARRRRPAACSGAQLEQMGVHVHLENDRRRPCSATAHVDRRLRSRTASTLDCDLVVIAAGIRPNVDAGACAPASTSSAASSSATIWLPCRRRRTSTRSASAPSIAAASTAWWRRCGSRRSVLADRLTGRNPRRRVRGLEHVDQVEGAGRRPRGDGRQGAGRRRRRGRQLRGAVARHLQEADRPQQPAGRRHHHRRRRGRAGAAPGVRAKRLPLSRQPRRAALPVDRPRPSPPQTPDASRTRAQICNCNGVSKAQIVEAVLGGAAACRRSATRRGRAPAAARAGRKCRRSSSWPAGSRRSSVVGSRRRPQRAAGTLPTAGDMVVTLNKIERYKQEKDGLDIVSRRPALAHDGWEAIDDGDRERLKWAGVFFRRQTPGPLHDARPDVRTA